MREIPKNVLVLFLFFAVIAPFYFVIMADHEIRGWLNRRRFMRWRRRMMREAGIST